jgi:hypothetical protein
MKQLVFKLETLDCKEIAAHLRHIADKIEQGFQLEYTPIWWIEDINIDEEEESITSTPEQRLNSFGEERK